MLLIELRDQRAILRVAGTCVNDDAKISGLDNEGLKAHQVLAAGIDEVDGESHDEFDDSGDTHTTHVPRHRPDATHEFQRSPPINR